MKTNFWRETSVMKPCSPSVLILVLMTLASEAFALPRFGDWARVPTTCTAPCTPGTPIANAYIRVRDERGVNATLYQDAQKTPLANPFRANGSGYYQFFVAENGFYQIGVGVSPKPKGELYSKTKMLVDPTGPQTMFASPQAPALTLTQVTPSTICIGSGDCCNAALIPACPDAWIYNRWATTQALFERRSASGVLDDAPWTFNGYLAERNQSWHYNSFGAQVGGVTGAPILPNYPVDNILEDNVVDAGNFGLPSLVLDWHGAGIVGHPLQGIWLAPQAGQAINVDLGIDGPVPAPGEAVVIAPSAPT